MCSVISTAQYTLHVQCHINRKVHSTCAVSYQLHSTLSMCSVIPTAQCTLHVQCHINCTVHSPCTVSYQLHSTLSMYGVISTAQYTFHVQCLINCTVHSPCAPPAFRHALITTSRAVPLRPSDLAQFQHTVFAVSITPFLITQISADRRQDVLSPPSLSLTSPTRPQAGRFVSTVTNPHQLHTPHHTRHNI